jgi:hypothetical protein
VIVDFAPQAIAELEEAFAFYEARSPGLGHDFRSEATHALSLVADHPNAWQAVGGGLRQCKLTRFPYALVYGIDKQRIVVIAVAYLRRKPRYWRKRWKGRRT